MKNKLIVNYVSLITPISQAI